MGVPCLLTIRRPTLLDSRHQVDSHTINNLGIKSKTIICQQIYTQELPQCFSLLHQINDVFFNIQTYRRNLHGIMQQNRWFTNQKDTILE